MTFKIASCVLILACFGVANGQAGTPSSCVFNSTHCACSPKATAGGTCFRKQEALGKSPLCTVGLCAAALGSLRMDPFEAEHPVGQTDIPCTLTKQGSCLTKVEVEAEYKMVQVGSEQNDWTLFNMTYQSDDNGKMLKKYQKKRSMHDSWPGKENLKNRQLNFRLYEAPSAAFGGKMTSDSDTVRYVCMIINDYKGPNDGLKNYKADSTITSLGNEIQFMQCDDWKECKTEGPAKVLEAKHRGIVTHSDGWCAGPIDNETGVSIKVTKIQRLEGINFLGGDGVVSEFSFMDGSAVGMSGIVDSDGLVDNGELPEIVIKPAGILKKYV